MSSYPIPIRRLPGLRVYRREEPLLTDDVRLCMVAERLSPWPSVDVFHGLPWLTPVLGSGCLDLGDGPRLGRADVEGAARRWSGRADLELPGDFGEPGRLTWSFVAALEADRRTPLGPGAAPAETVPVSDSNAGLALLTALLTWLYPATRMVTGLPSSRWWAREEAVTLEETRGEHELRPAREASLTVLKHLLDEPQALGPADGAVRRLLGSIQNGLERRRIALDELRVLTEVTWLNLIEGSSVYPGWSDLLLRLVIRYSDHQPPRGVHPNLIDLTQLGDRVAELLRPPMADSWRDHVASDATNRRTHLYRAVATLLAAQADIFSSLQQAEPIFDAESEASDFDELYQRYEDAQKLARSVQIDSFAVFKELGVRSTVGRPDVPHPTCFVTSFDIELEMALWAAGTAFRLVLPVLVRSRSDQSAELVWLVADIDPPTKNGSQGSDADDSAADDNDLAVEGESENANAGGPDAVADGPPSDLTNDPQRTWRVASTVFEGPIGGDRPVVVRLSGTPLFVLPKLQDTATLVAELKGAGFDRPHALCHALTVDEYTSMRFSENEWFFAGQASKVGDRSPGSPPRRFLPSCLASSTRTNERVWLALGVQLDDPAIRSRMLSQFSAAAVVRRMDDYARDDEEVALPLAAGAPDVRGIAVNRRMDEDEAIALHWLGFDIALDTDCGNLTPELEHCVEHLDAVRRALQQRSHTADDNGDGAWGRANEGACELRPDARRR